MDSVSLNRRPMNTNSTTDECRLELIPEPVTIPEETPQIDPPSRTQDFNNNLITILKDNLSSTFPFALILILKGFYDHSAGREFDFRSLIDMIFLFCLKEF